MSGWGNQADAAESVEVDDPHGNDVIVLDKTGKPISIEIISPLSVPVR